MAMVDREKVLAVLRKRFPGAASHDVATAANAIVGLESEFVPIAPGELLRFDCEAHGHVYTLRQINNGDVRVFRRKGPA
jgi:hypothetical protein